MELDRAKALLEAEGLDFRINETKPPKVKEELSETLRVIRVRHILKGEEKDTIVELIVCRV